MTKSQKFKMGHVSFGDALTSNAMTCYGQPRPM